MWIATDRGFYSVVKIDPAKLPAQAKRELGLKDGSWRDWFRRGSRDPEDDLFFVRGRVRQDLDNLCEILGIDPKLVIFWNRADYPYRVVVDRGQLATLLVHVATTLDYPNFKNRIHAAKDQAWRYGIYTQAWSVLRRLERHDWPERTTPSQPYLWESAGPKVGEIVATDADGYVGDIGDAGEDLVVLELGDDAPESDWECACREPIEDEDGCCQSCGGWILLDDDEED